MGIYDFKHGVRIPAGSSATYSNTSKAQIISSSGGLAVFNYDGRIDVQCVCQLPVPEKAQIRQFVMVGNVDIGEIYAELGGVRWNVPRQHILYASVRMLPTTPYEVAEMRQKKMVVNLPVSGNGSLSTDRILCYFIQASFRSDSAVSIEQALEVFYFEIYWD
ncbi:MAG: hypothetical protein WA130_12110 [Candidatus Methanoperedens sp.]